MFEYFVRFVKLAPADQLEDDWGFTPLCQLNDNERFKDCLTLKCVCASCKEVRFAVKKSQRCVVLSFIMYLGNRSRRNSSCSGERWRCKCADLYTLRRVVLRPQVTFLSHKREFGTCKTYSSTHSKASDCYCYLSNRVTLLVRDCIRKYYDCWLICDDHSCGRYSVTLPVHAL